MKYQQEFSPDGKSIAFTGEYDGGNNVYIMPSDGGTPDRITYNPGGCAINWLDSDGSKVIFRSYWQNVNGRDPESLFC